jgi:membrane protease YdiL (CAAX protease family)
MEATWKTLLLFIAVYIGGGLVAGVLAGAAMVVYEQVSGVDTGNWLSGYNGLILDGVVFCAAFFSMGKIRRLVAEALDFSVMRKLSTYVYVLGAALFMLLVQIVFIQLLNFDDASKQAGDLGVDTLAGQSGWMYLLAYFSLSILTPVKEEILFRGILHRFLEKRYHFWVGLIVSSLVFGLLHFDFPVSAILMGAVFVYVYRMTRSLVPAMLLHIVWNSFSSAMQFLSN